MRCGSDVVENENDPLFIRGENVVTGLAWLNGSGIKSLEDSVRFQIHERWRNENFRDRYEMKSRLKIFHGAWSCLKIHWRAIESCVRKVCTEVHTGRDLFERIMRSGRRDSMPRYAAVSAACTPMDRPVRAFSLIVLSRREEWLPVFLADRQL